MSEVDQSGIELGGLRIVSAASLWMITVPIVLLLVGMGIYASQLAENLLESVALDGAARNAQALQEFRTLYTSEVVERALASGVTVTHDYEEQTNAIPLPATFSIMLGNRMTSAEGGQVRLYSDYPFPWRTSEGGPQDEFERQALEALSLNPADPYYQFVRSEDEVVLRYAIADPLRPSCVGCHNTHPGSPKTDWKVGDVRGVLEITHPLEPVALKARTALRSMLGLLLATSLAALGILGVLAARMRRSSVFSQRVAEEMRIANLSIKNEMASRLAAEQEKRALEAQVLHVQKLESIGLLAGGIAHDFNNVLSTIMGNSELALLKLPEGSAARTNLQQVTKGVDRAAGMTSQLLAYAGQAKEARVALDANQVIIEMTEFVRAVIPKNQKLTFELEEDLPLIEADPGQLQQVLVNLITNASDAIGEKQGHIQITSSLEMDLSDDVPAGLLDQASIGTGFVVIEVTDNGVGMTQQTRSRMFDPFFSTKGAGRGLGMAALQGIVRSHNGFVLVDSALGKGTAIQLAWPVSDDAVLPVRPTRELNKSSGAGMNVLVVDDEPMVLETLKELLESRDYKVVSATSGRKALVLFEALKDDLDVVLLDMQMPEMSGRELYRVLRERKPELPIIFVSGYKADLEIEELTRDEATRFLSKPYPFDDLHDLLQGLRTTA